MGCATCPTCGRVVRNLPNHIVKAHPSDGLLGSMEVIEQTGITYRQLDYWCRTGIIEPTIPGRGSGSARRFTEREVDTIRALVAMLSLSFAVPSKRPGGLKAFVEHVREHGATGSWEFAPGVTIDLAHFVEPYRRNTEAVA